MNPKCLPKSWYAELNLAGFVLQFGVLDKVEARLNFLIVVHIQVSDLRKHLYLLHLLVKEMLFELEYVDEYLRLTPFLFASSLHLNLLEHQRKLLQNDELVRHSWQLIIPILTLLRVDQVLVILLEVVDLHKMVPVEDKILVPMICVEQEGK